MPDNPVAKTRTTRETLNFFYTRETLRCERINCQCRSNMIENPKYLVLLVDRILESDFGEGLRDAIVQKAKGHPRISRSRNQSNPGIR